MNRDLAVSILLIIGFAILAAVVSVAVRGEPVIHQRLVRTIAIEL